MARTATKSTPHPPPKKRTSKGGKKGRTWDWNFTNTYIQDPKKWTPEARMKLPQPKSTVLGCVFAAVEKVKKGTDKDIVRECMRMGIDQITKQGPKRQVQLKLRRLRRWGVVERSKNTKKEIRKKKFVLVGSKPSKPAAAKVAPKAAPVKRRTPARPAAVRPKRATVTPQATRPSAGAAKTAKRPSRVAVKPTAPTAPAKAPAGKPKRVTGNPPAKKPAKKPQPVPAPAEPTAAPAPPAPEPPTAPPPPPAVPPPSPPTEEPAVEPTTNTATDDDPWHNVS